MWLRDFLVKDLPQCRTLTYGYNSKLHSRGINTLFDYCAEFLEELKLVRATIEESRRPLILLGHSFGGLIVAQTLVKAKQLDRDTNPTLAGLYDSIIGFMFFATPHRGLLIDDIQAMVGEDPTHPRATLIEKIGYNSQWLVDQLRDFKNLIRNRPIINFIEMQQTRRLVADENGTWARSGDFVTALGPESALLQLPDDMEIKVRADADHSSIVKFDTVHNPIYLRAIKYLRQCEEAAARKSQHGNEMLVLRDRPPQGEIVTTHGQAQATSGSKGEESDKEVPEPFDISTIRRSGLTVVYDPSDPIADIVLIPGITGDPLGTWASYSVDAPRSQALDFWPADSLPLDCPNTRILLWGFQHNAGCKFGDFLNRPSDLLRDLLESRPLARSLIFVTYSFGGLILKEALLQAEKSNSSEFRDIVVYTTAVVYFGTPHREDGDSLSFSGVVEAAAASIIRTQNLDLLPLEPRENDPKLYNSLEVARQSFILQWEVYNFRVKTFAENPPSATEVIIPGAAASFGQLNEDNRGASIDSCHERLCQFPGPLHTNSGYITLRTELQTCLNHIRTSELHLRGECLKSLNFNELQNREFDIANPLESTATWIFNHRDYLDWVSWEVPHSDTHRGLLWLKGKPGSGKSTLMKESLNRTKASTVDVDSSICIAGFFFTSRTNVKLQKTPLGLFRTLLHDLIKQDRALLCTFISEYKKKNATSPTSWQWRQEELEKFFRAAYSGKISGVRRAMLFVDALDECDDDDSYNVARDLVYYFREITAGPKLKVLLSSRHYPHIKVPGCPQVVVENFNSNDVLRFVSTQLSSTDSDGRAKRLAEKIAARAEGVFLWVILVVKSLNVDLDNERTDADLEETLNAVPKKLEDLFEGLFASAPSPGELYKAMMIFQWVLLAGRPLGKDELRQALTIDRNYLHDPTKYEKWAQSKDCLPSNPDSFQTSLRFYTRGLTEIVFRKSYYYETSDEYYIPSSTIQFIHESVREYFLRGQGFRALEESQSHMSIPQRHYILAEYCMVCIRTCGLATISAYPFLRYATRYLFFHTGQAEHGGLLPKTVVENLVASEGPVWVGWLHQALLTGFTHRVVMGAMPLHLLCAQEQLLSASFLLGHGVDVNAQDRAGDSALHYSVVSAAVHAVRLLIENGADIHIRNLRGQLPLHCIGLCRAEKSVLCDVFRPFLVDRQSIVGLDSKDLTPLHEAVRLNNLQAVQTLLVYCKQPDLNLKNRRGDAPLHIAVSDRRKEQISIELLAAGADPNIKDGQGRTPLHIVSSRRRATALPQLLHSGANVNARDHKGRTPLHTEVFQVKGMYLLIAAGADVHARTPDPEGWTPLHFAAGRCNETVFKLLAEAGADVAAADAAGTTPMDIATYWMTSEMHETLWEKFHLRKQRIQDQNQESK